MAEDERPDPLEAAATAARLHALHRREVISAAELPRLLERAASGPDDARWAALLDRALLATGAGLCVAAVIYFFAGNWADLTDAAKLGSAMLAVIACAGWALWAPDRRSGRVALTAAAGLTGALLAVYGQIYQTGADAWTLFAGWSGLLLPWLVAARDEALTTLWLVVVALAVGLAMEQGALDVGPEANRFVVLGGVPGLAWVVAEALPAPRRPARWFVRLAATGLFACVTLIGLVLVFDGVHGRTGLAGIGVAVGALAGAWILGVARARPIDLYLASMVWLSGIILATALLGRILLEEAGLDEGGLLLLALAIIGQVGGAAAWLRRAWQRGAR